MTLRVLALASTFVFAACGDDARPTPEPGPSAMPEGGWLAAAPDDRGRPCADVGDLRACWDGDGPACAGGVCLVARPLPAAPPARDGWRCHGEGSERRCVPRRLGSGAFDCDGAHCTQAEPRLPDAGFWECIDDDGIVVCRGGEPAAGVFPAAPDPGFACAGRRGERGQRVCIDASPDRPDAQARGWRCTFEHEGGERRVCTRDADAPAVGAPCEGPGACARGTACAAGRCLPVRLAPECWLDRDCGEGRWCRFGTCTRGDA